MLNRIILIGRLATEPELKYTTSGIAVCNFRLAVDRPFKSQSGEREADFITVKVWRQQAENVANYLAKGRMCAIDGRLEIRQWVAQDGSKRSAAEVVADNVRFLDRGPSREDNGEDGYDATPATYGGQPAQTPAPQYQQRPAAPAQQPAPQPTAQPTQQPSYAGAPAAGGYAQGYDPNAEPDFGDPFAD